MIDVEGFQKWLDGNVDYCDKAKRDVVSRMKRCDKILEWPDNDGLYQYKIQDQPEFKNLSMSVRSQCKKAIKLYTDFAG